MDKVKNRPGRLDHVVLKSGASHKWSPELSRLIKGFLHADFNDGIIIDVTANLLCIFDI